MNCVPLTSVQLPLISEELLLLYVSHCATCLRLSYHTIKLYLCGIRSHYISKSGYNPLLQPTGLPLYRLQNVLRGIRKHSSGNHSRARLPITTSILHRLCTLLRQGVYGNYLDHLLEAVFCLAFFGFLRCGEFTTPTRFFDASQHLCFCDLTALPSGKPSEMHLFLKTSKTDPYRLGCTLVFHKTDSFLCPVTSLWNYLTLRYTHAPSSQEPLFLMPDSSPLTRTVFIHYLRELLQRLCYNPLLYAGHSFRKGAATSAAQAHIPDHLMKVLGRWSSDCYQRYITTPPSLIKEAQYYMSIEASCA